MNRKYRVSNAALLVFAEETIKNFRQDLASFTAFDADFNADKISTIQTAVTNCYNIGTDESVRAEMKQLTEAVNTAMKNCQDLVSTLRYFAKKAFGEKSALFGSFGFKSYANIRSSQDRMSLFFSSLEKSVAEHRKALREANMKASDLGSVPTLAAALREANAAQNRFINAQPVKTAARLAAFNTLYDLLLSLSEAADYVFKEQPQKRDLYTLPYNASDNSDEEEEGEAEQEGDKE